MEIKLSEVQKELNIGLGSLRPFLEEHGIAQGATPNTRIDKKTAQLIIDEFRPKIGKEEGEKLLALFAAEKKKESKPSKAAPSQESEKTPKEEISEPYSPSNVTEQTPTLKILGHLDKSGKAVMNDKPIELVVDSSTPSTSETSDIPTAPVKAKETKTTASSTKTSKGKEVEVKEKASPKDAAPKATPKEETKKVSTPDPASKEEKTSSKQHKEEKEVKKETTTPVAPKSEEPVTPKVEAPAQEVAPAVPKGEENHTNSEIYRPSERKELGVTVVGKIDLNTINPPKKTDKGERNRGRRKRIGSQAVDVKSEAAKGIDPVNPNIRRNSGNNKNGGAPQGSTPNNQRRRNKKENNKPVAPKQEITEEDVQKQVKETLARLQGKKTSFEKKARIRKDRRDAARQAAEEAIEAGERESRILKLTEFVTVSDLANMMDVPVNEVIATCMSIDMMVSINMRLDAETIKLVAEEFGFETEFVSAEVVEAIQADEEEDKEEDLVPRAPIVTVMGHVDHGKTSLLDNIRKTNVIAGEAGGITQHIGSYNVQLPSGRRITFLDTPGHEAFTAMRARGAQATDIAIIIIASDDKVMPQTKEAINHAAAAGVPMVFAFNKIDVQGADPNKIREQLAAMNYLVEDWGGKYQCQEISAKKGIGVNELLEKVLLEADMLDLKANPNRRAQGLIIESSLDKGRGYVSNILVHNGTLHVGDIILAGKYYGRVKAMFNERNQSLKATGAGPSVPATILGFNGAPSAGDTFNVLESEQEARDIATRRTQLQREQGFRTQKMLSLDEIGRRIAIGNFQELNLIIKGDMDGSVEALSAEIEKLSTEEIGVNVIHRGVGQISESDVVLAEASQAVIIGFQVRPSAIARKNAEQQGVEIRTYSIIYDAIADVKSAMEGMLSPEIKEVVTASLDVQQTFTIGKVGTIAGCLVKEGKIKRTDKVRVIRDGIVIHSGELESLKRFKDDVKEVALGLDCGLNIKGFNDLHEGDVIESYEEIEVKKTL
ncbi:translation initiation factor IF-2 [Porphyromonas endodontalis]|uniref:Translation initiation factor IF-2 n=1 Tax=Porphyromonas endodontalis (strain ATCC 35406 / DSM 24491 / JCM 8526 / CCUG 16442 / BCRC 14492 / NCTC 13058 / HG 370) TaxID=553175 RepID=C3JBY5_POREA|nr:translation initiation factor IF-2 [Porphyromonas endodontalis]EEN82383.1 translation initiation factor IF-2 [Porphyromonas endodontalis ATCC 35406]UBH64130.1 translation initiation factor IF-2 [Porphyromonas endodontalis]SUB67599.1 Translation initiation factor IF-2 [Porphyromonas endodontalis]